MYYHFPCFLRARGLSFTCVQLVLSHFMEVVVMAESKRSGTQVESVPDSVDSHRAPFSRAFDAAVDPLDAAVLRVQELEVELRNARRDERNARAARARRVLGR